MRIRLKRFGTFGQTLGYQFQGPSGKWVILRKYRGHAGLKVWWEVTNTFGGGACVLTYQAETLSKVRSDIARREKECA